MTGNLTIGNTATDGQVVTIKSSNATGTYIQFVNGTTPTVEVGYNVTYGAYLYNDKFDTHPTLCLGMTDNLRDAIIYRYAGGFYNVWHSGSLKPYQFTNWADTRSVNHVPNDYNGLFIMRGIKNLTTIGLSDGKNYATVWGWRGWSDKTGGQAWEIASTNEDLYTRHGETTSWTSWAKILNSSNYQNYPNTKVGVSTIWLYPEKNNEINFGGTFTTNGQIFFGYTSKDNRPKPTEYHFGQNDASLHGKYFQSHIPTGTQPFQCVSTTTCTNLNADMVDGYHSNDLTKRVFIAGIPGGAGSKWIRIGVLKYPSSGDSNTVMITISNSYNYSMNRSVTFIISLTHHASKPIITQLNGYPSPFTAVRILAPKDSNGSYTYGDRYVDISYSTNAVSEASNTIYLTAINLNYYGSYHFVPNKSFVDGSTIPSNYGEIWNFPFTTGLGSNANIYSQDGLIEGGTLKLSSTSTFGGTATFNGWINSTGIIGGGAHGYNVGARFTNTSHDSIEIVGGNYTMGLGCHSNGSWHWWRGTANPTSSTNKSYVMEYDGSTWAFTGSITATAAITAKATSDFRLKENYDGLIDYRERLLKLGRVYDYNYNKKALDLYQDRIDNKRHTGLVYQNAVKAGITNFCHEKDEYGYGSLNYLSPDLIATIIGSVQANILSIRLVESEQERMRKELEHAKSEINRLKGLVASLQN